MLSPAGTTHGSLSNGGQLAFLQRLAQDGEFRAKLENDPQATLAEYDLEVDPRSLPAKVVLPDEPALSALADTLKVSWPPDVPWAGWLRG